MPRRWWGLPTHLDRKDEHGNVVTTVMLQDQHGQTIKATSGDYVLLRKDKRTIGVIDRVTPSRVRVLVDNKFGNYLESNLIYFKSGQPNRTTNQVNVVAPEPELQNQQRHQLGTDTQGDERTTMIECLSQVEERMCNYTNASIELYVALEKLKIEMNVELNARSNNHEAGANYRRSIAQTCANLKHLIQQLESMSVTEEA